MRKFTLLVIFVFALGFAASAQYAGWTIPEGGKEEKKVCGWQEGAKAATRRDRQEATRAPDGPERTVLCVKVRVH